jgi:hypothetical protein
VTFFGTNWLFWKSGSKYWSRSKQGTNKRTCANMPWLRFLDSQVLEIDFGPIPTHQSYVSKLRKKLGISLEPSQTRCKHMSVHHPATAQVVG